MDTTIGSDRRTGRILVSSVTKSFSVGDGEIRVLHDLSLEIAPSEIVAIVGASGIGKSTLLRLVTGALQPDSGSVQIDGDSPAKARAHKHFGLMPQAPALLPWRTVIQNVRLPLEVNRAANDSPTAPEDALALVGLSGREKALPSQLSGGMAHRVAMARAIVTGAPVLLLDEPFSSLDELTRESLYEQLFNIWQATAPTVVFVTHNLTEALTLSDRVVVLAGKPATIRGEVRCVEPRPRTGALDHGDLSRSIAEIRTLLEEGSR